MPSLLSQTLGISAKSSSWGWMEKAAQEKRIEERLEAERMGLNDDTKAVVRALKVLNPVLRTSTMCSSPALSTLRRRITRVNRPSTARRRLVRRLRRSAWRAAQEVDSTSSVTSRTPRSSTDPGQ